MTTQPIVAIDLGSTKVACAIGLPFEQSAGFELLGTSLVAYPAISEGWLGDPLVVSRTIEQALEATAVPGAFDRAVVAISPPTARGELSTAAVSLGDEPIVVRAQDLERLQRMALDRVLGVDREPLLVERLECAGNGFEHVRDPQGLSATRLLGAFHIVTMPMAARRAVVQAVEAAGLEVARLTSTLTASWAGATDETTVRQRLLLIDVGGLSTTIGLFADGVLKASAHLDWGGLTLASGIASALSVTREQAAIWTLEGLGCRRAEVQQDVARAWTRIKETAEQLVRGRPRPDAVLVSGRGALLDGFAEWIEQALGLPTTIGRSARLSRLPDLSQQVGLTAAIGLLELMTRSAARPSLRPTRFVNRLLDRTRSILTEYF